MSNPIISVAPPGNHCTLVPDSPAGFNFRDACWRHDINMGPGSPMSFTQANDAFRKDLHGICSANYGDAWLCHLMAEVYFVGVSVFGRPFYEGNGGF